MFSRVFLPGGRGWDWDWESLDPLAQKTVLRTAFFAANWFVELISAFSVDIDPGDPDILYLLVHRLRHVIYLRRFLGRALYESSELSFVPPPARFEMDPPRTLQFKAGGGSVARRGVKRKA
jgi:hypothetical protein